MEPKGHAAAFLEIRKKSYLGAAFRGPRAIWLGCKLNPREYDAISDHPDVLAMDRRITHEKS